MSDGQLEDKNNLSPHDLNLPCTVPHDSFNISKNSDRLKIGRCNGKQWRPCSDCSSRSSLIWVCTACLDMFVWKLRFIVWDHMAKSNYLWICTCMTFRHEKKYFLEFKLVQGATFPDYQLAPSKFNLCRATGASGQLLISNTAKCKPDLDPNCLTLSQYFWKKLLKKLILKKNQQTTNKQFTQ